MAFLHWRSRFWLILRGTGISIFTPTLWGRLTSQAWLTVVEAKIGVHPLIRVFFCCWWFITGVGLIMVGVRPNLEGHRPAVALLVAGLAMFLLGRVALWFRSAVLFDLVSAQLQDATVSVERKA